MIVTIEERVQAGMAFLDEHFPDHVNRVDLVNLSVWSPIRCPLAQAGQDYYSNVIDDLYDTKGIDLRETVDETEGIMRTRALGFLAPDNDDGWDLNWAWVKAYQARRDALING